MENPNPELDAKLDELLAMINITDPFFIQLLKLSILDAIVGTLYALKSAQDDDKVKNYLSGVKAQIAASIMLLKSLND